MHGKRDPDGMNWTERHQENRNDRLLRGESMKSSATSPPAPEEPEASQANTASDAVFTFTLNQFVRVVMVTMLLSICENSVAVIRLAM